MIKKTCIVLICFISIFIISSCGNNNNINSLDETNDENINENVLDSIANEKESISLEGLLALLLEANAIELKNINNETLGVINDRNKITQFVNRIFEYEIKDDYTERTSQNVIGPINIYFNDGTAIYGLMKENYMYIDGYYFLVNRNERNYIISYFGNNIQEIFTSQ